MSYERRDYESAEGMELEYSGGGVLIKLIY